MTDTVLTVRETARLLKVSKATICRWCVEGKLPAFKIGRQWRINAQRLDEIIANPGEYTQNPTSKIAARSGS